MFELFLLLAMAGAVFVGFVLLAGLFKLVFNVALIPVVLAVGAVKVVLAVVGVAVGLVVLTVIGPILMVVLMFALPVLLLGGLAWAAISVLV